MRQSYDRLANRHSFGHETGRPRIRSGSYRKTAQQLYELPGAQTDRGVSVALLIVLAVNGNS
jgi:hypothetical protein